MMTPRRIAILCLLPFWAGLFIRLARPLHQFMDTDAMACAGLQILGHGTAYDHVAPCPGMIPMPYVYTPPAAWVMAILQRGEGMSFTLGLYGLLYFGVLVAVFRYLLRADALIGWRSPFLLSLSGSAVPMGNFSVILHGMVFFAAMALRRRPALLWPVVVLAGALKPTFCVYAVLLLFCEAPLRHRLMLVGGAILAFGGLLLLFHGLSPQGFAQWTAILGQVDAKLAHGHGFMFVAPVFVGQSLAGYGILYLLYAAALGALTLKLAPQLTGQERMMFGVLICLLLYPRLMDYDLYTAPFGLAVLACGFAARARFRTGLFGYSVIAAAVGGQLGGMLFYLLALGLLLAAALYPGWRGSADARPNAADIYQPWRRLAAWRLAGGGRAGEKPVPAPPQKQI